MNGSVLTVSTRLIHLFVAILNAWTFSPVCHTLHVIYHDVASRTIAFAVYLHTLAVIQFAMHAVHASATVYVRQLFFYILSDPPPFAVRLMENALLLWSSPERHGVQRTNFFFHEFIMDRRIKCTYIYNLSYGKNYTIHTSYLLFSFYVGFYFLSWFISSLVFTIIYLMLNSFELLLLF